MDNQDQPGVESVRLLHECLVRAKACLEENVRQKKFRELQSPEAIKNDIEAFRPVERNANFACFAAGMLTWVGMRRGFRASLLFAVPASFVAVTSVVTLVYAASFKRVTSELIQQPSRESLIADMMCAGLKEMKPCLADHGCRQAIDKSLAQTLGDAESLATLLESCQSRTSNQTNKRDLEVDKDSGFESGWENSDNTDSSSFSQPPRQDEGFGGSSKTSTAEGDEFTPPPKDQPPSWGWDSSPQQDQGQNSSTQQDRGRKGSRGWGL